eukprot:gene17001-biopygen8295
MSSSPNRGALFVTQRQINARFAGLVPLRPCAPGRPPCPGQRPHARTRMWPAGARRQTHLVARRPHLALGRPGKRALHKRAGGQTATNPRVD